VFFHVRPFSVIIVLSKLNSLLTADFIWSEIRDRVQFDADRFTWWLKISRKSRVNTKGNLYKRPTKNVDLAEFP